MADLIAERLPQLLSHRVADFDLGDSIVQPFYEGNSILNIPSSICKLLNIPPFSAPMLDKELLTPIGDGVQHVLFILVDGLALHRFQRWIEEGSAAVWKQLSSQGVIAPLTSVLPSTTTSALTSLWCGQPPKAHGIIGYELWLKEYGIVTNMVLQTPMTYQLNGSNPAEVGITRAGFKPKEALQMPTFGTHLMEHGVQPFAFQHFSITSSGLSQMFLNDVSSQSFSTAADLWVNCRHWLEKRAGNRSCAWIYWGELDHLSHHFGPDDERARADFMLFSHAFQTLFLEKLAPELRKKVLIILTADHGQIYTPVIEKNDLRNHPRLNHCLHIKPTGENRIAYLFVRPGRMKTVREYVEDTWRDQFHVLPAEDFIKSNLLGYGKVNPVIFDRVGDLVLLAKEQTYLWWGNKENHLLGRHGGMHPEEMLVPFLAARLG